MDQTDVAVESACSLEKFIEVSVALDLLSAQEVEPAIILELYGITASEFSRAGAYWWKKIKSDYDLWMPIRDRLESQFREGFSQALKISPYPELEF